MSSCRVIWSSPEIHKKNKLKNAKLMNDLSSQLLKFQVLFFVFLIFEIYFNLLQKILSFDKQYFNRYKLICKTLLTINLFFLICYAYQIIHAKFTIYAISHENKLLSMLKSILFDIMPQLKSYHEVFIQSKIYLRLFKKSTYSDEEKERARLNEERRKMLTKSYFPSMIMHQHNNNFNDRYVHRPDDHQASAMDPNPNPNYHHHRSCSPSGFHNNENEFKSLSSTPFNNMRVGSINFGGDITPIHSPGGQLELRTVPCMPAFRQPLAAAAVATATLSPPPRIITTTTTARYSPGGIFINRSQPSGLLTEVPINEVWKRLEIDQRLLNDWTFSLRQWIHGTIINRVVNEIDDINRRLMELGITDVVIGESNVQTLRHLTNQPVTPFPTLGALINFLDCSKDQAYVVNRLKELAQGCSLGKFQWDGGSSDARHPWKEHLPNDTMLVLHMLCTYIEVRYAVHSNLHGVRTFSQQFITDNVMSKDANEMKDAFLLYQTCVQPPHFKVIFNQSLYEIPPGRKNLFHCLLVFFYKIYSNEGNFKWLNLGRSGMNINNIFAKLP